MSPLGESKAALRASHLVSMFKEDSDKQSVLLKATGRRKVTFVKPLIFGDTDPFTGTEKVDLPGVITISTNGSWPLTPKQ